MRKTLFIAILASMFGGFAFAHPGHYEVSTFAQGLDHPISGLDHILAMVGVGVWAALYNSKKGLFLPLGFVVGMLIGVGLAFVNFALPLVENVIALSVMLIGIAIAFKDRLPIVAAASLTMLSGVFHGYAHGAETGNIAVNYIAGFMATTIAMHAIGGLMAFRFSQIRRAAPVLGSVMAVAGVLMLAS